MMVIRDEDIGTLLNLIANGKINKLYEADRKVNSSSNTCASHKSCKSGNCTDCDSYIDDVNDADDAYIPDIRRIVDHVTFNEAVTIVFWVDGTKTTVRCNKNDTFSKEIGIAMAVLKKVFGSSYYNQINYVLKNCCVDTTAETIKKRNNKTDKKTAIVVAPELPTKTTKAGIKKSTTKSKAGTKSTTKSKTGTKKTTTGTKKTTSTKKSTTNAKKSTTKSTAKYTATAKKKIPIGNT